MSQEPVVPTSIYTRWLTVGALLLLAVIGLTGIWLASGTVASYAAYPPDFDESVHLLPVWQLARAWAQGDVATFWQHTIQQDQLAGYPFFHAWLTFPVWLLSDDVTTVRLMSLIYMLGAALFAFGLGHDLCRSDRWRWLAGFVSGGLVLLSFPLWVYGSLAYLEGAGLLVTMAALWLYGRSCRTNYGAGKWPFYTLLTSLAITAAFFTKYNFGLFLVGGIGLNELVQSGLDRQIPWRRWAALALPFLIVTTIWFLMPDHLHRFLGFSTAQEGDYSVWQVSSWFYYPRSLVTQYVAGWGGGVLVIAGLIYGVWRWRDPTVRGVLSFLVASYFLLLIVPQKEPRFLYVVAPATFLLAGPLLAEGVVWLQRQRRQLRWLGYLGIAAFFLWTATAVIQRFRFYQPALDMAFASTPETAVAYQFLSEQALNADQSLHMLNSWHLLSEYGLLWHHLTMPNSPGNMPTISSSLADPQALLIDQLREQETAVLLSIDGSPAGDYTGWAVVEPLVGAGRLELLASSPPYTIHVWDEAFRDNVLAGNFSSEIEMSTVMDEFRHDLTIRLHLYQIN